MARFGPRVIALSAQMIEGVAGTFILIGNFLNSCGIPPEVQTDAGYKYGGRIGHLERVLYDLDENQPDRFTAVLQQLIRDLRKRRADEQVNQLEEALKERGFLVSDDQKVRPADNLVDEDQGASDYLDELISRNQKYLTRDVIVHHLEQHWNLYSEGTSPGAATNEARQVIEQILEDIANTIATSRDENPDLDRPVKVRNYLTAREFFDEARRTDLSAVFTDI